MHIAELRELCSETGPFVSVYVDDSHDTADAAQQARLTKEALRRALDEQGADEHTAALLDDAIRTAEPPAGSSGRALIASGRRLLVDERLPTPPKRTVTRVSSRPYLLPLLSDGRDPVPHVVVTVDRVGADIVAVDDHGVRQERSTAGQDHPVHKVRGGGLSHRNIQARAEQTVAHNVDEVATHVARTVEEVGARVLVLAGEVTARAALRDALPERARSVAVETRAGGRAAGSGNDALVDEARELVDQAAERHRDSVIERFHAESGRGAGLAAQGLAAVTPVLREAAADNLLIGEPADVELAVGPEPTEVALRAADLPGPTHRAAADEALPFAALASGAGIVVSGSELALQEGFAAVLRHP